MPTHLDGFARFLGIKGMDHMNSKTVFSQEDGDKNLVGGILRRLAQIAIAFTLQAIVLFACADTLNWIWAWTFLGISVLTVIVNATIMLRSSPETIAERGRAKLVRTWDKIVAGLWSLALFVAVPLIAGFDRRFEWTQQFNPRYNVVGAVVLVCGLGLTGWAMISNAYFSTAARIQTDRGQTVCRTGPYRFVRHPGYAGAILQSLATPLLLGSLWALLPGVLAAVMMVIRTSLEDRMLQAELTGYPAYVQEVRRRLIPLIW